MPSDSPRPPDLPGGDLEQLLLALGELYDAVLDPGGWAAALERFGQIFGGAAVLFAQDSRSPRASVFSTPGFDPGFVGTSAVLAKSSDVLTEFSVIRPANRGEMPPDRLALLGLLMPHFQRAVRVHRELRQKDVGINAALHGLACLDSAAFVTDERARVVFLNSVAEELLRSSRTLRLGRDRILSAASSALTTQLHALVAGAAATACLSATHPGGMIALPRAEGRPLVALVSPFRTETAGLASPSSGALVLLRDPDRTAGPGHASLQALFGMTRAEALTAIAITAGDNLAGIAAARGVSLETVRTQAKRAMEKAGVRRQAELVSLVLSVPTARRPASA